MSLENRSLRNYFEFPERSKALGQQAAFPEHWQGKNPSKLKVKTP